MALMRAVYATAFADPTYSVADENARRRFAFAQRCLDEWGAEEVADVGAGRGHFRPRQRKVSIDLGNFLENGWAMVWDLTSDVPPPWIGAAAVCLDVLEHIAEEDLATAVENLASVAPRAAITVANHSSMRSGVELHLTQKGLEFWRELLSRFYTIDAIEDHGTVYYFKCEQFA